MCAPQQFMHFHSTQSYLEGNSGLHFPRVIGAGCQACIEKGWGRLLLYGNEDKAGLRLVFVALEVLPKHCIELLHCSLLISFFFFLSHLIFTSKSKTERGASSRPAEALLQCADLLPSLYLVGWICFTCI